MKLIELIKFAADNRVEALIDNDEVNFYTFDDDGERFRQISIHPDVLLERLLDISGFEVELA
jgi:hypothetical protein